MIERGECPYCTGLLKNNELVLSDKFNVDDLDGVEIGNLVTSETSFILEMWYGYDENGYMVPKVSAGICGLDGKDGVISVNAEVRFCPMCGRDLIDYLDANFDEFGKGGAA